MGACTQGGLAIVTEYLPGDNLQNVLKNPKINLSLTKRLMMAKEAAQGINWLHCMKPSILHRGMSSACIRLVTPFFFFFFQLSERHLLPSDIKPANLLVDKNYHIRVCDFGFAAVKVRAFRSLAGSHLVFDHAVDHAAQEKGRKIENPDGAPGSPIWMGPEVLQGLPVDEKSDVYSFGIGIACLLACFCRSSIPAFFLVCLHVADLSAQYCGRF
jgi:serine/threonine protein kinase